MTREERKRAYMREYRAREGIGERLRRQERDRYNALPFAARKAINDRKNFARKLRRAGMSEDIVAAEIARMKQCTPTGSAAHGLQHSAILPASPVGTSGRVDHGSPAISLETV